MAEAQKIRAGQQQAHLPGHGREFGLVLHLLVGDPVDVARLFRDLAPRVDERVEALGVAGLWIEPRDRDLDDPVMLDGNAGGLAVEDRDRFCWVEDRRERGQEFPDGGVLAVVHVMTILPAR